MKAKNISFQSTGVLRRSLLHKNGKVPLAPKNSYYVKILNKDDHYDHNDHYHHYHPYFEAPKTAYKCTAIQNNYPFIWNIFLEQTTMTAWVMFNMPLSPTKREN